LLLKGIKASLVTLTNQMTISHKVI